MRTVPETTVRDIATTSPAAVQVFEKYHIDYCCGGNRAFAEVCGERGLAPETVLAEVALAGPAASSPRDWLDASLTELIAHIVSRHHGYLKRELPALEARSQKVLAKHGAKYSQTLSRLHEVFLRLKDELDLHLQKEEMILFPAIEALEAAEAARRAPAPLPFGTVRNPIRMMEHEHGSAGEALAALRSLTDNYAAPGDACTTFLALYQGLAELERDLHTHIHLENNILFPRAAELEQRLG